MPINQLRDAVAGYVDQEIDVEDYGGGMILIDPLLDDWMNEGDEMGLAA